MAAVSPELATMADAVEILSDERCRVDGEPVELAEDATGDWKVADAEPASVRSLAATLYQRHYTRMGAVGRPKFDFQARRDHLDRLSQANHGCGTWEPGWTIRTLERDSRVTAEKHGLSLWVAPHRLRVLDGEPAAGAACQVRVGKELRELQPEFYFAIGDGDEEPNIGDRPLLRYYWHLTARGAVPFMDSVTSRLNLIGVPFQAKVLSDPQAYLRADAGVIYLSRSHESAAREEIAAIWRTLQDDLRPAVPLLTRQLAPGLSVAEDPGKEGFSFGQHRSMLVARGLWRAFEQGRTTQADRLNAVAEVFYEEDLDPCRPYLRPGSKELLPLFEPPEHGERKRSSLPQPDFEQEAYRLGDTLVSRAWWHDGRCNWIGHSASETDPEGGFVLRTWSALDSDLYGGTAGVGLFLAQLYSLTGERTYRRTACGALRQALERYREESDHLLPLGFLSGWLGTAWAASRVASLSDCDELAHAAEALLAKCLDATREEPVDIVAGHAGAVLILLHMYRTESSEPLLEKAIVLGEELCRTARKSDTTWCWPSPESGPELTGFSHGAAGMGLALLELFAATEREAFRAGARKAFAYEDSLFDEEFGNWPDLRPDADGVGSKCPTLWCHGAPGIALSRLRACMIDSDNAAEYRRMAEVGIATTLRTLNRCMEMPFLDCSLCHGQTGLAEIVYIGGEILGKKTWCARAREATRILVDEHGQRGDWPSGTPSRGPNPSLMLGEAGIGYWLLRLLDPSIPSVLLPGYTSG